MNIVGTYTCRGTIVPDLTNPKKITLFDGQFETGYRIKKFVVSPYDMDNTNIRTFAAKVATVDSLDPREWNWEDEREVAWSWFGFDANASQAGQHFSQVDTERIIVEDVYVYSEEPAGSTTGFMNYFIEFEKIEIKDWEGALAMANDKAMGDN